MIGKPQDLEPALNIPGGVVQTLRKEQADATVTASQEGRRGRLAFCEAT